MQYTSDLGKSIVTQLVLRTLIDEGKLKSLSKVRAPGHETVLAPRLDEAVMFMAFFDVGLRLFCVELVSEVM